MIIRLSHVAISVANMNRSVAFYCTCFGFVKTDEYRIEPDDLTIVMLKHKAMTLEEAQKDKLDLICRKIGLAQGMNVLDVGCGMGRYTLLLAEREVKVTGLDLSPVLLSRLREYNAERYAIPLLAADLEHPPVALHGGFDVVMGFFTQEKLKKGVLEYLIVIWNLYIQLNT